ncbi:TPA: hypothetical protein ACH3X1_003114 [Trebouxia sp. C0004]
MAGRSGTSQGTALEVYQDDMRTTPASTGATARPPKTSVLKDSTNTVHIQSQGYAYPKQGKSCTEQVLRARYPGAFMSEPHTGQLAAAITAGKQEIDVAALEARHPGTFLSQTDTPEVRGPGHVSRECTSDSGPTAPLPGASVSERELVAQAKAAHNVGGTGSISYSAIQKYRADAPPFVPQAAKIRPAVDSKYNNTGQTSGSYAVLTSPAPSWILPEDPFGPTPVKGKQAAPPTGYSPSQGLTLFAAGLYPTKQLPARRSLPFNHPPSGNSTSSSDLRHGPLIKTSDGIVLNPAFKAASHSGVAANASFLQQSTATSAAHLPMHAAPTKASGHLSRSLESSGQPASPVSMLYGNYPDSRPSCHSASVTSLGTASMELVYNIPTDRAPGYSALPLDTPSEHDVVPRGAMTSPRADVLASSAGTAANNHYRLPPMLPQKMASYCHVKHSRKEIPDLPKEAVKSLVQVLILRTV